MINQLSLSSLNQKTVRAYQMKEAFQQIYMEKDPHIFLKLLRKWYFWATHSRLTPINKLHTPSSDIGVVSSTGYILRSIMGFSRALTQYFKRQGQGVIKAPNQFKLSFTC